MTDLKQYSDSDRLYPIFKGYNEATRMLMFRAYPIEFIQLQEALSLVGQYNEFNPKKVYDCFEQCFADRFSYAIGREYSVVIYIKPKEGRMFSVEVMQKVKELAGVDEVDVIDGELRLWWD